MLAEEDESLIDTTAALAKKRLDRKLKKLEKKRATHVRPASLLDVPYELMMKVLAQLRPSDLFNLRRTIRALNECVVSEETVISTEIINRRYQALSKCFPIPRPIEDVEPEMHDVLLGRQNPLNIHWRPFRHIKPLNPRVICTCITCVLHFINNNFHLSITFASSCLFHILYIGLANTPSKPNKRTLADRSAPDHSLIASIVNGHSARPARRG
ncbi:hypothetical protein FKW77_001502 [Venturia effusa]|uniref:F-box domain-containing protein n=1 Tax=Venturia effusa TaxID=50376 RepID=A0A517LJN7_9PEZI|nr:hypothetical protein FKW77_001502 [Venturia effusa]